MKDMKSKLVLDDYSAITNISYTSNSYTSFRYRGIEYSVRYCNNGYYYLMCGDEVIDKTAERMPSDMGYYFSNVGVRGLVGLLVYMGLVESEWSIMQTVGGYNEEIEELQISIDDLTLQGEDLYTAFVNKLRKKLRGSIKDIEILCADCDYIRFRHNEDVYSVTLVKIADDERKHRTCNKLVSYNKSGCYVNHGINVVKNNGKEKAYGLNVLSFVPSFELGHLNELDAKTLGKLVVLLGILVSNKLESEANKLLDSFGSIIEELDDLKEKKQQLFNEIVLGKII